MSKEFLKTCVMKERLTYYCNSCEKTYAHILEITVVKENGTWGFRCPTCYPPSKVERERSSIEALLDSLTKEELEAFEESMSIHWCGTNWENKQRDSIEQILDARNRTPVKQLHPLKKLFSFLFS